MTPHPTLPAFVGWLRPARGRRWERACQGASYDACWSALLALPAGQHAERLVLPAGHDPNRRWRI